LSVDIAIRRIDDDVRPIVGPLFQRLFRADPPDYPIHYVAFVTSDRLRDAPMAYCHFTALDDCYFGGGMCFDDRAFRRLTRDERRDVRDRGGLARLTLGHAIGELTDKLAVFGYVGDKRARDIDESLGFRDTGHPRLIVRWCRDDIAPERRTRLVDAVAELGPF